VAQSGKIKAYVIGAVALSVSIGGGITAYHMLKNGDAVGFAIDWPPENAGLSSMNDAGTTVCVPPVVPCPEGSDLDTRDFTGRADPGAVVTLYRNNRATLIGTTTAGSDGEWTVPGAIIPEGTHTIIAEAKLGAKITTVSHSIFVDTTSPTWADAWDVPDGIDAVGGIYLHGCGCPDWCWPAETAWTTLESCTPSPGYRCGPTGDCHTDYSAADYQECKASRRAGCLRVSTPQVVDNGVVRLLEIHTSTYHEAGCWRVPGTPGYSIEKNSSNSTTTRFYINGYTSADQWVAGDTVLLEDCQATCALTADEERAVSVRGSNYLDVTPAASADLDDCCIHNLSRVAIIDDPIGYPPWDLLVGMLIEAKASARNATVAGITGTGPWSVTFTAPFFDHAPVGMLYNAAVPTDAQSEAWWDQTGMPDWVDNYQCVIPPNVVDAETGGPAACVPKSEWK